MLERDEMLRSWQRAGATLDKNVDAAVHFLPRAALVAQMEHKVARRWFVISAAAVASALAFFSEASACVPGSYLPFVTLQPAFGPAGSPITVQGLHFLQAPVEVRWNALDGIRLEATHGPDFSSTVTIPEEQPGLYAVVVVSRRPDGSVADTEIAMFQVTAADGEGQRAVREARDAASTTDEPSGVGSSDDSSSKASLADNPLVVLLAAVVVVTFGSLGGAMLALRRERAAVTRRRGEGQ